MCKPLLVDVHRGAAFVGLRVTPPMPVTAALVAARLVCARQAVAVSSDDFVIV
jgi:hypothetical protein